MVYMITVRGRFPEYSATLNISIPQRFMSSNCCRNKTQHVNDRVFIGVCACLTVFASVCEPTLASWFSCGVLTPKRGMEAGAKPGLCVAFFTPLICDIGLFFFSFSLGGGERISTSCCFSAMWTDTSCYDHMWFIRSVGVRKTRVLAEPNSVFKLFQIHRFWLPLDRSVLQYLPCNERESLIFAKILTPTNARKSQVCSDLSNWLTKLSTTQLFSGSSPFPHNVDLTAIYTECC